MDLKDLYRDVILDHNRQPRNFGRSSRPTRSAEGHNPAVRRPADGARCVSTDERDRGHPLRGPGLRHLHRLRLAHDRGGQGQGPRRRSTRLFDRGARAAHRSRTPPRTPRSASSPRSRACASIPRASSARACAGTRSTPRSRDAQPRPSSHRVGRDALATKTSRSSSTARCEAVIVPAGPGGEVEARPGRLHHPGARRQLHACTSTAICSASPARMPTPSARRRSSRRELPPERHRRGHEQARLGADAHLLRPRDPDQHRRPGAGVRVRRHARTRTARAPWTSR